MRVWIVQRGAYEDRHIAGVYASAEAAMAAHPGGEWTQESDDWWDNGLDWEEGADCVAYEVLIGGEQ